MHHGSRIHLPNSYIVECPRIFEFAREGCIVLIRLCLLLLFLELSLLHARRAMIVEEPVDTRLFQDLANLLLLDGRKLSVAGGLDRGVLL